RHGLVRRDRVHVRLLAEAEDLAAGQARLNPRDRAQLLLNLASVVVADELLVEAVGRSLLVALDDDVKRLAGVLRDRIAQVGRNVGLEVAAARAATGSSGAGRSCP